MTVKEAATNLSKSINAPQHVSVGVGDNEIVLYVHQRLPYPFKKAIDNLLSEKTFAGYPVRIQFVGRVSAL